VINRWPFTNPRDCTNSNTKQLHGSTRYTICDAGFYE